MKLTREELGLRLRFARQRAGIMQEVAGAAIELDATAISKIEHGTRGIDALELLCLAKLYHASMVDLLNEERQAG